MVEVKKKLMLVPNHKILGRNLLEIFYRALKAKTKIVADTITDGAFMTIRWELAVEILDQISNTNREAKRGAGTYAIGASSKQRIIDDTVAQEIT